MNYKNITKKDLYLNEIGLVKAGETVKTKDEINNPNFELIVAKTPENTGENKEVETLKANDNNK